MIITSLSVEGFRKVSSRFSIEFPTEGIIGISGRNECGKSTIFDAIEFALFGLSPRRTFTKEDILTWGQDKLKVDLRFSSGNKKYEIVRILTKKAHRVKLSGYDNNDQLVIEVDTVNAVEQTIKDIVGLDGESYSKLIYIRQNELDVLKDLERSDRTGLINTVMGIDVFDEAKSRLDVDCKQKISELSILENEVKYLKENHDKYSQKLEEKQRLEEESNKLSETLGPLEKEKISIKVKLEELKWLKEHISEKTLLESSNSELLIVESQNSTYTSNNEKYNKLNELYQKWEPEFKLLKEGLEKFSSKEKELQMTYDSIERLKEKLPNNRTKQSTKGLTRTSQLIIAIALLFSGGALLMASAILAWYFILFGILLVILSIFYFRKYKQMEAILMNNARDQGIQNEIDSCKKTSEKCLCELGNLRNEYNANSSVDMENKINSIMSQVKSQTGSNSLAELAAAVSILFNNLRDIQIEKLTEKTNSLSRTINERDTKLKNLIRSKPSNLDPNTDLKNYDGVEPMYEQLTENINLINNQKSLIVGKTDLLKNDCNNLKNDFQLYPLRDRDLQNLKKEIELMKFVGEQYKQVSAKLRSKVIPLAEDEINFMLPIITDNNYSHLEISEDLKFSVYTQQTGGLKRRELFSGGTQDQFLIVLRLAFTKSVLDLRMKTDEYCLFVDEATSSSDEFRKIGIFELLQKVVKTFRQIFVIAHEDISNLVDYHLILDGQAGSSTIIKSKSW